MPVLSQAGAVVTLTSPSLDARELLDAITSRSVSSICVVGDAYAKPIIAELEAEPGRWDLTGVRVIVSSGVMFSRSSKLRLLEHMPNATVVDSLGSSESGQSASAVTQDGTGEDTGRFRPLPVTRVIDIDDKGRDIVPGSGRRGRIAVAGRIPLGYYKDLQKTARTFLELDGRRHVVAGDWAEVEADGTIRLVGRGSSCINTGGEKVYPEEVETVLRTASGVNDVAVVGVHHERFGEAVVALVELGSGVELDEEALVRYVKERLAGYKAPKRVLQVDSLGRSDTGKLDHRRLADTAMARMGIETSDR
ncbi:MAG: AMP-binding enzyme [Acidimicrobiales bacterium]